MRSKKLFSPLIRIKSTGKITVLSYMGWRKFYRMPFSEFEINHEYKSFDVNEYVYNRKGEQLFFYDYRPSDIMPRIDGDNTSIKWHHKYSDESIQYGCRGLDCDGIPTFNHHTIDQIANNSFEWMLQYEPLTVGIVIMWLDWIMHNKVERINIR